MLIPISKPYKYSPAHSPVIFQYTYESKPCVSIVNANYEGFATVVLDLTGGNYNDMPLTDMLIYLDAGKLKGFHKIRSVMMTGIIQLETLFNLPTTVYACNAYLITNHIFDIYAGYDLPNYFHNYRPRKKIASFRPESVEVIEGFTTYKPYIKIDISGYLKSIFPVQAILESVPFPSYAQNNNGLIYLWGLFSQFELFVNEWPDFEGIAVNSAITADEFELKYNGTNRFLTDLINPIISGNCTNLLAKINDVGIYIQSIEGGEIISPTEMELNELLNA